ncbi:MAG: ABC transporter permease [Chloroflexota bacterium]
MHSYLVRRLLAAIPTIFGITVLIFLAMRVLPGDPIAVISSETSGNFVLSPEQVTAARASLGLDKPYPVQYLQWMSDVAQGNLGESFWTSDHISDLLLRRGPITAEIAVIALLISWIVGIPAGIISAANRDTWLDFFARGWVTLFLAIPSFWIGLVIVLVGILVFDWRPPLTISYLWTDPAKNLEMVVGPGVALGIGLAAATARLARSTVLEVLNDDYVRTARAKGLGERMVLWRHVMKNAMLPVVTLSGLAFSGLLSGTVATETAFGVPGLGTLLVQGLTSRDWMLVQNMVLVYGLIVTITNLLVDLSYGWLDPRIRYEG